MKILIITQAVDENNPLLGFFIDWIKEFSNQCDKVSVVCLYEGVHDLPENIKIFSLGKEKGRSRLKYLYNFYRHIFSTSHDYDVVFIHMSQIYVILGFCFWKLFNKKIGLWYAHGHVPKSLRLAEKLTDLIFTSTSKGFRIQSDKVRIVGQGINTGLFKRDANLPYNEKKPFKIITVGRISPVKDYDIIIKAVDILIREGRDIVLEIIGDAGLEAQKDYFDSLKNFVMGKGLSKKIIFLGSIANKDIPSHLKEADLFINASKTGSLDKAILEAMSLKSLVLSCNEALFEIFDDQQKEMFMFKVGDIDSLTEKISSIIKLNSEKRVNYQDQMREIVVNNHSLQELIKKIINNYEKSIQK